MVPWLCLPVARCPLVSAGALWAGGGGRRSSCIPWSKPEIVLAERGRSEGTEVALRRFAPASHSPRVIAVLTRAGLRQKPAGSLRLAADERQLLAAQCWRATYLRLGFRSPLGRVRERPKRAGLGAEGGLATPCAGCVGEIRLGASTSLMSLSGSAREVDEHWGLEAERLSVVEIAAATETTPRAPSGGASCLLGWGQLLASVWLLSRGADSCWGPSLFRTAE